MRNETLAAHLKTLSREQAPLNKMEHTPMQACLGGSLPLKESFVPHRHYNKNRETGNVKYPFSSISNLTVVSLTKKEQNRIAVNLVN